MKNFRIWFYGFFIALNFFGIFYEIFFHEANFGLILMYAIWIIIWIVLLKYAPVV